MDLGEIDLAMRMPSFLFDIFWQFFFRFLEKKNEKKIVNSKHTN